MRNSLGGAALMSLPAASAIAAATSPAAPALPFKLAISTYSYWHFRTPKVPIEKVIDEAAALSVEGVDILHRQMESEDNAYLQKLKRHAFRNGVDLVSLSIHQDFVSPDAAERQKDIDHTIRCIELAYKMGIPCIRLNSGRWGTIKSFDDLMAARGVEPAIPGYSEDDAFKWCIDSIQKCLDKAAECGVVLALENHWGSLPRPKASCASARRSIPHGWDCCSIRATSWKTPTTN